MNVFILEMVIMQCPLLFVNKLFVLQMLAVQLTGSKFPTPWFNVPRARGTLNHFLNKFNSLISYLKKYSNTSQSTIIQPYYMYLQRASSILLYMFYLALYRSKFKMCLKEPHSPLHRGLYKRWFL